MAAPESSPLERLIPTINRLQEVFSKVGLDSIDLPQIAVCGAGAPDFWLGCLCHRREVKASGAAAAPSFNVKHPDLKSVNFLVL